MEVREQRVSVPSGERPPLPSKGVQGPVLGPGPPCPCLDLPAAPTWAHSNRTGPHISPQGVTDSIFQGKQAKGSPCGARRCPSPMCPSCEWPVRACNSGETQPNNRRWSTVLWEGSPITLRSRLWGACRGSLSKPEVVRSVLHCPPVSADQVQARRCCLAAAGPASDPRLHRALIQRVLVISSSFGRAPNYNWRPLSSQMGPCPGHSPWRAPRSPEEVRLTEGTLESRSD